MCWPGNAMPPIGITWNNAPVQVPNAPCSSQCHRHQNSAERLTASAQRRHFRNRNCFFCFLFSVPLLLALSRLDTSFSRRGDAFAVSGQIRVGVLQPGEFLRNYIVKLADVPPCVVALNTQISSRKRTISVDRSIDMPVHSPIHAHQTLLESSS